MIANNGKCGEERDVNDGDGGRAANEMKSLAAALKYDPTSVGDEAGGVCNLLVPH